MVFSSNLFIFGFIPVFFVMYYILPIRFRNGFILISSLLFYEFGAGNAVFVLLGSIVFNYYAGRLIERIQDIKLRATVLILSVVINLVFLLYYKYTLFIFDMIDSLSNMNLSSHINRPNIILPIGISFFTFQAISYIVDIYLRHCSAAKSLLNFGMYHSLFPQLIAGPIVRYSEIESRILKRSVSLDLLSNGVSRFVIGLGKKIIIADHVGAVANSIFSLPADQLSFGMAWLGAATYTIQIYFDFSGYSDMAIGLGMLLGFKFPENFNYPYQASNITEFWRRWHMTLSRWFKDYVYIPLGGNRIGVSRTYLNLTIIFIICGLWHGAGYTFLAWGMFQGFLLIAERFLLDKWKFALCGILGQCYTLFMLMIGWVLFRSDSMQNAFNFFASMFSRPSLTAISTFNGIMSSEQFFFFIVGIIIAVVPLNKFKMIDSIPILIVRYSKNLLLFIYSMAQLSSHTFNPFLYFRF